jgi:hypothetical protein
MVRSVWRSDPLNVHRVPKYRGLSREQPEELPALCRECYVAICACRQWVKVGVRARRSGVVRSAVASHVASAVSTATANDLRVNIARTSSGG